MKYFFKKSFVFGLFIHLSLVSYEQDTAFLIGDMAPPIKYSKWLKGDPITSFDNSKLYVVEFWATWCGPCIAAMPHLSELAEKYKGKVEIVGVNVWEKIGDKAYETVLPNVSKFVKGMGDKMKYNVAVDNNDLGMAKGWLQNAGVPGIPTTFIIKEGRLVWLGHPKNLDSMIINIQAGNYELTKSRIAHEQSRMRHIKQTEADRKLIEPIDAAIAAKDFEKAFALMDKAIVDNRGLNYAMNLKHFTTLLDKVEEKQAIQFGEEWNKKDSNRYAMYMGQAIADRDGLTPETYGFGAKWFKPASERTNVNPLILDYLAKCYYLSGDQENAVITQEKAVEAARAGVKAGKFVGIIHDFTVAEYEEKLKLYRKKLAP